MNNLQDSKKQLISKTGDLWSKAEFAAEDFKERLTAAEKQGRTLFAIGLMPSLALALLLFLSWLSQFLNSL